MSRGHPGIFWWNTFDQSCHLSIFYQRQKSITGNTFGKARKFAFLEASLAKGKIFCLCVGTAYDRDAFA